jgi:cobalt/nickel transport system permease protein
MIYIDKYAYTSNLKYQHPMEKFIFSLLTMGVCLWANSLIISVMVLLIMGGVTIRKGGIPFSFFVKLLLIPVAFLTMSVLTIMINLGDSPSHFIGSVSINHIYMGVSKISIENAIRLFAKSMGAVTCLYYLTLTTPFVDLLSVFRMLKIPKLLQEMMALIYRFIFVLLETGDTIWIAQNARLGYSSLKIGYFSLGTLASSVFIRAYKRANELYTALEARGYDGELNVLEEPFTTSWEFYILPIAINLLLIVGTLLLRKWTGGLY